MKSYKTSKIKNKKVCYSVPNIKFKFLIIIIYIFSIIDFRIKKPNKVCMCVVAKKENNYIREFVEHYKKYDIDKIYIFDNNDKNGEKIENAIKDYIESGFVQLIDYKGIPQPQLLAYNDCYRRYNKIYDWLIFFDVDEYIYLKDFKSFKLFLNDKRFEKCNRVQLNIIFHTDNNQLYYKNKTLKERFTEREPIARGKIKGGSKVIKSVIRGNIKNIKITCPHILYKNTKSCDGFGKRKQVYYGIRTKESDFEYYYIDHYYCKSTEEFINNKLLKTDAFHKIDNNMDKINFYFKYNKVTKEKIDMIEKKTKYNLTKYRSKILQNKF